MCSDRRDLFFSSGALIPWIIGFYIHIIETSNNMTDTSNFLQKFRKWANILVHETNNSSSLRENNTVSVDFVIFRQNHLILILLFLTRHSSMQLQVKLSYMCYVAKRERPM